MHAAGRRARQRWNIRGFHRFSKARKTRNMLGTLLIFVLLLALFAAWPVWGYSRSWGYTPSGTIGVVLVFLLVVVVVRGL
jgi:sterol desaturase/sphingolipid hydroxylase (fatty acid hydroxylase superfamily)